VGRHTKQADNRLRLVRGSALTLVWLGGIAVGFFGILSVAARYGCSRSAHGLACRQSGSLLGGVIIAAVVAVVTAVTVYTHGRSSRVVGVAAAVGLVLLVACYYCAHALISTA
jgi:hypothetical protein